VKPAAKKEAVRHLQEQHGYSQRRACRLTLCNRRSARHILRRAEDTALRGALRQLAEVKPAWGYRMLHGALRLDGWHFNHKKAYRLYREEQLVLPKKSKRRLKCEKRGRTKEVTAPHQHWSMDFIHDRLSDGRSFRTLNLTDTFTRQCLGQEVDTSLSGTRVVRLLETVKQKQGLPALIRVDNGSEFRSKVLDSGALWAERMRTK
jgi:putative transposase